MLVGNDMGYSRLVIAVLLISPLVRSKDQRSFEKPIMRCKLDLIAGGIGLASLFL